MFHNMFMKCTWYSALHLHVPVSQRVPKHAAGQESGPFSGPLGHLFLGKTFGTGSTLRVLKHAAGQESGTFSGPLGHLFQEK